MRYVIVIVGFAFFLIWDGIYNGGQYTSEGVRALRHLVRTATSWTQ